MDTQTHLTHPQFLRALALARAHNHGWAQEFDLLGIDPQHRCEAVLDAPVPGAGGAPDERAWQRTRREKLAGAAPEQVEALQRVELARAVRGEVEIADLVTLTDLGHTPSYDAGIPAPALNLAGEAEHITGAGRLRWTIRRDGSARLSVCRPGAEMYRVRVMVRTQHSGWWDLDTQQPDGPWQVPQEVVRRVLTATGADRPLTRDAAAALIGVEGELTQALGAEGLSVASRLPEDPEPSPEVTALMERMDLLLELAPVGRDSVTALHAEVGPAITTREYADGSTATEPGHGRLISRSSLTVTSGPGTTMHLRHVAVLRDALGALGVEWDPQLALVAG